MENAKKRTLWQALRENFVSFLDTLKSGPDFLYILLVMLYIVSAYSKRIKWTDGLFTLAKINIFDIIVIFGCGAYLAYKIIAWKKMWKEPALLVLVVLVLLAASGWFYYFLNENWAKRRMVYTIVIDIILCVTACGKNYKRLLQCLLIVPVLTLLIAALGLVLGFTGELMKTEQADSTRSFGIIYPNSWGYIAFQALLLTWYLFLRKRLYLTFPLFWGMAAFQYYVVGCKTVAVLVAVFPLFALVAYFGEKRERRPGKKPGIFGWLMIALPVLCCAFSLVACFNMEWVYTHFYWTPLHSMAMRFVQGGIALDEFGFPLFGRSMTTYEPVIRILNGDEETLYVVDNAFSTFIVRKGVLWMLCCLAWLTAAQWKSWKYKDYGTLIIGGFMVMYAVMEQPGIEAWFNFVLFYPLASIEEPAPFREVLVKLFAEEAAPQAKTSRRRYTGRR